MRPVACISLVSLAALALSACVPGDVVVSRVDQAHLYDPLEVATAGGGARALPVQVIGNPYPEPPAEVAAALVAAMQGNTQGVPVNFALDPQTTDPQRPYRVVMVFQPGQGLAADDVCKRQAEIRSGAAAPDGSKLMGVLCSTDFALSSAVARSAATSIRAPAFDAMVAQLTLAMFPIRNPHDDRDLGIGFPVTR